ncbi:hypothetical protein ACQKNS_06690 [Peribacillus sp. NPDC094092]|uniref:hypothetical protein n=1 Tax=Peribacillus sp. NPDC094092 TaxID=3390611 RepID=UPI003D00B298
MKLGVFPTDDFLFKSLLILMAFTCVEMKEKSMAVAILTNQMVSRAPVNLAQ